MGFEPRLLSKRQASYKHLDHLGTLAEHIGFEPMGLLQPLP